MDFPSSRQQLAAKPTSKNSHKEVLRQFVRIRKYYSETFMFVICTPCQILAVPNYVRFLFGH